MLCLTLREGSLKEIYTYEDITAFLLFMESRSWEVLFVPSCVDLRNPPSHTTCTIIVNDVGRVFFFFLFFFTVGEVRLTYTRVCVCPRSANISLLFVIVIVLAARRGRRRTRGDVGTSRA